MAGGRVVSGCQTLGKHFQMCYLRSKDEEMEAPCWREFSISVLGLTGLWSRVCAPDGWGSCLPGDVHQCLADAGVSWSQTPLWALSSWRFRQEAGMFLSLLLSLRGFVQNPMGCPTGFSRSLCSLRYRKEAKDGWPNTLTINQTLFTISSLLPYINPLGRHAIRAHVYTFLLKRYHSSIRHVFHLHVYFCICTLSHVFFTFLTLSIIILPLHPSIHACLYAFIHLFTFFFMWTFVSSLIHFILSTNRTLWSSLISLEKCGVV